MNMSEFTNEYVNIYKKKKQLGTGRRINVVSILHLFGSMFGHGEQYNGTRDLSHSYLINTQYCLHHECV